MHHRGSNFRVLRCVYSLLSFVVFTLMFSSFLLCSCYFSSELALIIYLIFFSAALNRRPYDCMHSAGEDGGLERVFIKRLTNTNCVAEKRSTAAYTVSHRTARITFTACLIPPGGGVGVITPGWWGARGGTQ